MNSLQWLLMNSFRGPVGLASSSITPPASSKTLTIFFIPNQYMNPCQFYHFFDPKFKSKISYLFHILKSLQRWGLRLRRIHGGVVDFSTSIVCNSNLQVLLFSPLKKVIKRCVWYERRMVRSTDGNKIPGSTFADVASYDWIIALNSGFWITEPATHEYFLTKLTQSADRTGDEEEELMAASKLQALWNHPAGPKTSELTLMVLFRSFFSFESLKRFSLWAESIVRISYF